MEQKIPFCGNFGSGNRTWNLCFQSYQTKWRITICYWSGAVTYWQCDWMSNKFVCLVTWMHHAFFSTYNFFCLPFSLSLGFEALCIALYQILSLQMKTISTKLEFLSMQEFRDTQFVLQRRTNTWKKHVGVLKTCEELCRAVEVWFTVISQSFFWSCKGWILRKRKKRREILSEKIDGDVENSDDHGDLKTQGLVDHRADEQKWICSSYPFWLKTHSALHLSKSKGLYVW